MKEPSLQQRAEQQAGAANRAFQVGGIAMLPAGVLLLVSAIVQLSSGNYRIGENFYGEPIGPGLRGIMGLVFSCIGAILLWRYIRTRGKMPSSPDGDHSS